MSYENTTLVASRYGAMGADPTCGPGQVYHSDVTWAGIKGQCLTDAQYNECKSTGKFGGQPCSASSGGVFDTIKSIGGALVGLWGQSKTAPTPVQQPGGGGGTPDWLMPVAIGAVGIAAIVLLKKKRKNPARGRRRRRRNAVAYVGRPIPAAPGDRDRRDRPAFVVRKRKKR